MAFDLQRVRRVRTEPDYSEFRGAGQVHVFDPFTFAELNPAWLARRPATAA
jgi:hypothetical protein